jgi:GntR family transcriptional regulator
MKQTVKKASSRSVVEPSDPSRGEALWTYLASCSPGDRLPPEPELARMLGISRPKLREHLRALAQQGLISRVPGVGTTLVHPVSLHADASVNMGVTEMIRAHGMEPGTAHLHIERRGAVEAERHQLGLADGESVWVVDRVRTANGKRIATTLDIVPAAIVEAANMTLPSLEGDSLYDSLSEHGHRIQRGVARISPLQADPQTAERLEIDPGSLLLHLEQVDYDQNGTPILLASENFVAADFSLVVVRRPHL